MVQWKLPFISKQYVTETGMYVSRGKQLTDPSLAKKKKNI
jgi:hypothetical protein